MAELYLGNSLYAIERCALALEADEKPLDAAFYRAIAGSSRTPTVARRSKTSCLSSDSLREQWPRVIEPLAHFGRVETQHGEHP